MAEAVAEGARSVQGVDAELTYYAPAETLSSYDAILVGVPTHHHDMAIDIEKFFEEAAEKNINLQGKAAAAFGSYGWSGEASKLVVEIMKNKFMMNVTEQLFWPDTSRTKTRWKNAGAWGNALPKALFMKPSVFCEKGDEYLGLK